MSFVTGRDADELLLRSGAAPEGYQIRAMIRNELESFWKDFARRDLELLMRRIKRDIENIHPYNSRTWASELAGECKEHEAKANHDLWERAVSVGSGQSGQISSIWERGVATDIEPTKVDLRAIRNEGKNGIMNEIANEDEKPLLFSQPLIQGDSAIPDQSDEEEHLLQARTNDHRTSRASPVVAKFLAKPWLSLLREFVQGEVFEFIVAFLITINAISIGLQVNLWASGWTNHDLSRFDVLNRIMFSLFYIETGLRAYSYRPTFFDYVLRNRLDNMVILFLLCSEIYSAVARPQEGFWRPVHSRAFSVIRIVRNFRLLRILRSPSVLRLTRRLRVFVASLEDSLSTLICAFIYIFLINYIVAVLLTTTVAEFQTHASDLTDDQSDDARLVLFFSSVPAAMLSLWELAMDGYVCGVHWGSILSSFYGLRPLWVSAVLILFVSVTKLGVLTIITGIFTMVAMKNAEEDTMFAMHAFALEFVRETDLDGDTKISCDEFLNQRNHPFIREFFPDIADSPGKARRVFLQVDVDGSDCVSLDELVRTLAVRAKF